MAIAALVLAIPSALLATHDLVQRFKKKAEADRIIKLAQTLHRENPQTTIRITTPDGMQVNLHQTDGNALLDMAQEIEQD